VLSSVSRDEAMALLDACPLAVVLLDASGQIRACNRAFAGLTGTDPGAGLGGPEALRREGMLAPLLGSGTLVNWIMPDGVERWFAVETQPLGSTHDATVRFYIDVTEKLRLRRERDGLRMELKQCALKDETLTTLLNRRGLLQLLQPLVARSRRYDNPLSVVAIGVDVLMERQQLLTRIAYLLRDQTRWADLLGCNDGHDFLLILQETSGESALRLVDKLSAQLQRISAAEASPVHAFYGVTHCQREDNAESLLERAETALGEARARHAGAVICR
jgi:diguanylate cyclase (GGDEF)-like protein